MIRCRNSYLISRVWLKTAPIEVRLLVAILGNPANQGFVSVPLHIGNLIESGNRQTPPQQLRRHHDRNIRNHSGQSTA